MQLLPNSTRIRDSMLITIISHVQLLKLLLAIAFVELKKCAIMEIIALLSINVLTNNTTIVIMVVTLQGSIIHPFCISVLQ